MTDVVKFGIIGAGAVWRFHKLGAKNKSNMIFTAAYDIDQNKLDNALKFSKLQPFSNLDNFLKSDIDAVLVLAPHYLHKDMVIAVAEAGKHVLCEKPMAPTLEDCDEMIAATKKARVKFMIAENHRFLPAHQFIKKALDDGFIGDVMLARTYEGAYCTQNEFLDPNWWHFSYDKGGGGVVSDQGVHKFTLLNWFLGKVDFAQCWMAKTLNSPPNKGEDTAIINLRYKCGAMVTVDLSSSVIHPITNRTELHGTKGSILEDHSWDKPVKVFSSHPDALVKGEFYSPDIEHQPFPGYYKISMGHEDSYFADCILEEKEPAFTPQEAREGVAVVLLAYLSAKNGRITKMDELIKVYENQGTRSILEGLEPITQKNYESLVWS